jgi:hypothetical protein
MATPAKSGQKGNDLQKQRADEPAIKQAFRPECARGSDQWDFIVIFAKFGTVSMSIARSVVQESIAHTFE